MTRAKVHIAGFAAKPHQNNRVRDYFIKKGIEYVDRWPPYSPDLNMIELVWPLLNERIAQRHPSSMPELQTAIKAAWKSISVEEINAICSGFRGKLKEVFAKGGCC